MKRKIYSLILAALACTSSASAQWNTNATSVCIYPTTGGDEASSVIAKRLPDGKTWIGWRTWDKGQELEDGTVKQLYFRNYVQLLDKDGKPVFEEPILVNNHPSPSWISRYGLDVTPDGCVVVSTADSRGEEADKHDNYNAFQPAFYKIDQEGNQLWGLDGITYPDYQDAPFTRINAIGDDVFVWFNDEKGCFINRISQDGVEAWEEPVNFYGQLLDTKDGYMMAFDMTGDGSRVRKLDRDLQPVWDNDVIYDDHMFEGHDLEPYKIVADGKGGAAVAFVRNMGRFAHNIRVQYISADGETGFGLTGVDVCNTEDNDFDYPGISLNPATEEIMVDFQSKHEDGAEAISLAKFNYQGDYLFGEMGFQLAKKIPEAYAWTHIGTGGLSNGDWIVAYLDVANWADESLIVTRIKPDGTKVWKKTIGRHLDMDAINMFVEEDATYFYYRERNAEKEAGVKIFRIFNEKGDYKEPDHSGIETNRSTESAPAEYYTVDGKRLAAAQKGLNIVKMTDGTVEKVMK